MRIAVAGAGGFVGRDLVPMLAGAGHTVVALARRASTLPQGPGIEPVAVDVGDRNALAEALAGVEVAYYLVHSMAQGAGFEERDLSVASNFAEVASQSGTRRIVYVGALGSGELSTHLASRRAVGDALRSTGVEVVELRAAVVLGAGSISFEMLRYLVERLPFMICPRWLRTRIQPIAMADLRRYLAAAIEVAAGVYEIGGEVTTYEDMIGAYARVRGLVRRRIVHVPVLSLALSAYWVDLVTPVDRNVSHVLIESLASEVLAADDRRTRAAFGFAPMGLDQALGEALGEQASSVGRGLFQRPEGLVDGVYTVSKRSLLRRSEPSRARDDLACIGGDLRWYGTPRAWRLRLLLGRLWREDTVVRRPATIEPGGTVDWWTIRCATGSAIILQATRWAPGEAWLGYRVSESDVLLAAAFRPRGVPGLSYWKLLRPIHAAAFRLMVRARADRAR